MQYCSHPLSCAYALPAHALHMLFGIPASSLLCAQELRQAAHDFDFGVPASSLVGDDSILQCALSQLRQQRQRQEQLVGRGAPAWSQSGVLLLSNDKVMQLKVSCWRLGG